MLIETGEEQDALRKIRSAYMLDKDSAYVNFSYGVILLRLSKYKDAKEKFEQAINVDSKYDIAYLGLAEALFCLNEIEEVFDVLEVVSSQFKNSYEFLSIKEKVLNSVVDDPNVSQYLLKYAYEYCNKFLELYNNDIVLKIKDLLQEKINLN